MLCVHCGEKLPDTVQYCWRCEERQPPAVPPARASGPEQTQFEVVLLMTGRNMIGVVKAVRELTQLGLKESVDLVESVPQAVLKGVSRERALWAKHRLEQSGATVAIR